MFSKSKMKSLIATACMLHLFLAGLHAQTQLEGGGVAITLSGENVTGMHVTGKALDVAPTPFVSLSEINGGTPEYVTGKLRAGKGDTLKATFADLGVTVELAPQDKGRYLEISARVIGKEKTTRGYLLRFSFPFDALNWLWHDDMQTTREIAAEGHYQNTRPLRAFADMPEWEGKGKLEFGHSNRNFCTVLTGPAGLCLAMPLDRPCLHRTSYNGKTRCLELVFDFALSPDSRIPNQTEFKFLLYACDPNWGFRDALQRYYDQFPQWFERYARRQGQWMAFSPLSQIDNADEFGFALQEGAPEVDYDDKIDVLSAVYFTHAGMGARIPNYDPEKDPLPAHDIQLKAMQNAFKKRTKQNGIFDAVGLHDRDGKLAINKWSVYAHLIAQFNLDPDLPYGKWTLEQAIRRSEQLKEKKNAILDGFYYDGLTTGVNYRRDHFKTAESPILWDPFAKKPFIYNFFSSCEFSRAAAELLRPRGQITMMNGALGSSFYIAPWLDIFGAETGLRIPRESFNYIRTVIHRKPFMTLLKGNYEKKIGAAEMELYMKRCLAYGVFPGFFDWPPSGLGPGGRYWDHPAYFERDRSLFRKYQPLCLALAEAGWSPVTQAHSSSEAVPVERYGPDSAGAVYLSLLNETSHAQNTTLRIDAGKLGFSGEVQAINLLTAIPVPLARKGEELTADLHLPPDAVVVLQLANAKQVLRWRLQQAAGVATAGKRMREVDRNKPARPIHWFPSGKTKVVEKDGKNQLVIDGKGYLRQWAMLFQDKPAPLTLRARIRANNLQTKGKNAASIRCRIAWVTSSFSHYEWLDFPLPSGSYEWQDVHFTIQSEHPLRAIDVRPTVNSGATGELWLDKLSLSDSQDHQFLLDPEFTQIYRPLPESLRPEVENSYERLAALLNSPGHEQKTILAALSICNRLEQGILGSKAENGGRRILRDTKILRHHLNYALLAAHNRKPPALILPDTVVAGDKLQPQISDSDIKLWNFRIDGQQATPPFDIAAETAPGTILSIQAICPLGKDEGDTELRLERPIRVVEPLSLELQSLGGNTNNAKHRIRLQIYNNSKRKMQPELSGNVPPNWQLTLPTLPAIDAGKSATAMAWIAPSDKGKITTVPVTFTIRTGTLSSKRTIDILYLPTGDNRIRNPGFEHGLQNWGNSIKTGQKTVNQSFSGEAALQLLSKTPSQIGAYQTVTLNQETPCALLVQACAQAQNVSGSSKRGFSLYVDLYHTDGSPSYGHIFPFDPTATDWQLGTLYIEPQKPVARANVYLLFRQHTGTVRYDDIMLLEDTRRQNNLAHNAKVSVDSCYSRYSPAPLTDGITEPGKLHWSKQSWASSDSPKPHHVQFDFPRKTKIRRLVVHWSRDAGILRTSRHLRLEAEDKVLWQADKLAEAPSTEILLPAPVSLASLRLVQPVGGGSKDRPHLLWIREIEIFGN